MVRHASEEQVIQEIREMRDGARVTLSDAAAGAIASWYQSPGEGRRFAILSTTGNVPDPEGLREDIAREREGLKVAARTDEDADQRYALFALGFWIDHKERDY